MPTWRCDRATGGDAEDASALQAKSIDLLISFRGHW
jgi:hypothetical protein